MKIGIVIPAVDEEEAVGQVVLRCRQAVGSPDCSRIVVGDNESRDQTSSVALSAGAEVVQARPRGYGTACLEGTNYLGSWPDVLVFLDADGSSRPEEIKNLLEPIREDRADFVIGVRSSNTDMTMFQIWGNRLATRLITWRWGQTFSDLGPFRAIRRECYEHLQMRDPTWGWNIEMQILAVVSKLRWEEVAVSWEPRIAGVSKISGSLPGATRAGVRILWTFCRYAFRGRTILSTH